MDSIQSTILHIRTVEHALATYNDHYVLNLRNSYIAKFQKIDILGIFDPTRKLH